MARPTHTPVDPLIQPGAEAAYNQREANKDLLAGFGIRLNKGKVENFVPEAPPEGDQIQVEEVGGAEWVDPNLRAMPEDDDQEPDFEEGGDLGDAEPQASTLPPELDTTVQPAAQEPPQAEEPVSQSRAKKDLKKAQQVAAQTEKALEEIKRRQKIFEDLAASVAAAPTGSIAMVKSDPEVAEFYGDYPQFGMVIDKMIGAAIARIERTEKGLLDTIQGLQKMINEQKGDAVINRILSTRHDAEAIAQSPEFRNWLSALPPAVKTQYSNIIYSTSDYTAEDALWVLDQYDAARGAGPRTTETPAGTTRTISAPPAQRMPGDALPTFRRGGAAPGANGVPTQQIKPFSRSEFQSYGQLMGMARDKATRDVLNQRLQLTLQQGTVG